RVFVANVDGAVEVVVLNLLGDGLGAVGPIRGVAPIADFDGIADDVVAEVLVLQHHLLGGLHALANGTPGRTRRRAAVGLHRTDAATLVVQVRRRRLGRVPVG